MVRNLNTSGHVKAITVTYDPAITSYEEIAKLIGEQCLSVL